MKYDVIIIGSGFGGLACAHILSKAGKNVLVLERQAQPGGCIQSYPRQEMMFDTGLHYVGGLAEGQPINELFSELGLMHLPWHRLDPEGFDRVTICGETYSLAEGYDAFVDTLSAAFPEEREGLRQYVEMLRKIQELKTGDNLEPLHEAGAYDWLTTTIHNPRLVNVLSVHEDSARHKPESSVPLHTYADDNRT